jgi:hypothetical protein
MSAMLKRLLLSLTPLSVTRVEKATYPGREHYNVQKQVRDLQLTGTFIIDYQRGVERMVRWEATDAP